MRKTTLVVELLNSFFKVHRKLMRGGVKVVWLDSFALSPKLVPARVSALPFLGGVISDRLGGVVVGVAVGVAVWGHTCDVRGRTLVLDQARPAV
jgi:hypothetical protein